MLTMTGHLPACPDHIAAKQYDESVINAKHYAPWVIDFRLPQLPALRKLHQF